MWGWFKSAWKGVKKVVNAVVRPVINFALWPARQLVKGSFWVVGGFLLTRTKGTDRIKSRNIDLTKQIQSFKCYKCFIGNSIGSGIGSVFTKILSNQMIMHWWAEIQTIDGKYYICQFNHPHKAPRNVCELIYCSSSSVVAKRGRSSSGNNVNCRVYYDDDFDIICDSLVSVATLKDVWDFMNGSKWSVYDLFYINCQHFVKGLYKYIKQIVGKNDCRDIFINPFTITTIADDGNDEEEDDNEEEEDDNAEEEEERYHPKSLYRSVWKTSHPGNYKMMWKCRTCNSTVEGLGIADDVWCDRCNQCSRFRFEVYDCCGTSYVIGCKEHTIQLYRCCDRGVGSVGCTPI
eukprot:56876_1